MVKTAAAFILSIASALAAEPRLILLHSVDKHEVLINPAQVASLRSRAENKPTKLLTEKAECQINLTDGRYVTVIENCQTVRELIERRK
jgi:hypothetical protein